MFCFYEPWLRLLTELVLRGIHIAAHCIELYFRLHSTYSAMQLTWWPSKQAVVAGPVINGTPDVCLPKFSCYTWSHCLPPHCGALSCIFGLHSTYSAMQLTWWPSKLGGTDWPRLTWNRKLDQGIWLWLAQLQTALSRWCVFALHKFSCYIWFVGPQSKEADCN